MRPIVGSFPYKPGLNPYQQLITDAMESVGLEVVRIAPQKWFPIQKACAANCDILHLDWPHDWYAGKNQLTAILKRLMYVNGVKKLKHKPTVWTAHNLVSHDSRNEALDRRMIQLLINQCRGIMVMSEASRLQLQEYYTVPQQTEVRTIYHGHYIDCYPNKVSRADSRVDLEIPKDQFVYLTIGTIKPYKGHEHLIQTFLRHGDENDLLIIAGGGDPDYVDFLRDIVSDNSKKERVKIVHGIVSDDQLQYFFNACDVTVLPFLNILNSGSLLLATSFGSPVVAPRIGSIPEIAYSEAYFGYEVDGKNGQKNLGHALKDAKATIQGLEHQKIKDAVIQFARTRYCWEKIGLELADWYKQILKSPA